MYKKFIFLLITAILPLLECSGQRAYDYQLTFDRKRSGKYCLNVKCCFSIDFEGRDSIGMFFGGNLEDYSINGLRISSGIPFEFRPERKMITFYRAGNDMERIRMRYSYVNMMSALLYGESDMEIWETTCIGSPEYYYPMIYGVKYNADIRFDFPDSLHVIASCGDGDPREIHTEQCVPVNFACFPKSKYRHKTIDPNWPMDVYEVADSHTPEARYSELSTLIAESVGYFQTVYRDPYICPDFGVNNYPAFVFHTGTDTFNRYNMGFVSASQRKFSTFPDIYPLVHEIGHRWIGEYSILMALDSPGSAFIIESVNEFMTLMFIYDTIGPDEYMRLIEKYRMEYLEVVGTEADKPVIGLIGNSNVAVVYRKGPVILDMIASEIGYENMKRTVSTFYNRYKGVCGITYRNFIDLLGEEFPEAAQELHELLQMKSLPVIN